MDSFDVRTREDLSSVVDTLLLNDSDMRMLSFVNFLPSTLKVTDTKHEWLDDSARLTSTTTGAAWNDTDTTDLDISSDDIDQIRVGDQIVTPADEMVVVKSVDTSANTVDVYERGHGSTTAATVADGATLNIVGNAQVENADPLTGDATIPTEMYNHTQIFEDVINVSGSLRRSRGAAGDEHDAQVIKKMKELLISLNYSIAEGIRNNDTTNKVRTMGGLREFLTTTYNFSGAPTIAKIHAFVAAALNAGGTPTQIHASVNSVSAISQLFTDAVRYEASDNRVGLSVKKIEVMGLTLELYPDRHVRSGEVILLDRDRVSYGPLAGGVESGAFASYALTDKQNGKQHATQLLGEYTMELRQAAAAGVRGYGIS